MSAIEEGFNNRGIRIDEALNNTNEILNQGKDLNNFLWEIIKYVKDVLIYKSSGKADLYSEEEIKDINNISQKVTKEKLVNLIYELSNLENGIKWSTQKTIMFQAGIIKLCSKELATPRGEGGSNIEERVQKIENYLKSVKTSVSAQPIVTNNVNTYTENGPDLKQVNTTVETKSTTVSAAKTPMTNIKNYSSDLSKSWPKIVNDLKQNGKIVLYTNLMNTKAEKINEGTVGIKFQKGITAFGRTVLEKQENIKEISNLISMACGKDMQIKYISDVQNQAVKHNPEDDIQKLAKESDIPFNIVE